MTAETEVRSELSEVSKVAIEEKCGVDMSSYGDLPKGGGDCNGVDKEEEEEEEEQQQQQQQQKTTTITTTTTTTTQSTKVKVNGNDDPDGTYVFVSRSGSANGDGIDRDLNAEVVHESHVVPESKVSPLTKDIEGQIGELNGENGETVSAKDNCIAEGTDVAPSNCAVAPSGSLVKPTVDGDDVLGQDQDVAAVVESEQEQLNAEVKIEEQIEPDLAPDLEENRESPTMVLEVGHCGTPQLDDGKIQPEEQTPNFESTAELREVRESQIAVMEAGDLHDGEEKSKEQKNLESTAHFEKSDKPQVVVLEASECKSSLLNDSKLNSEKEANIESATELEGSQESKVMVSEVTECKLPEVEVGKVMAEKQTKLVSPSEVKESLESQVTTPEYAEPASFRLENGEEKLEEEEKTDLGMDIKENQESQLVVTDNILDQGNEAAKLAIETDVLLETEIGNELVVIDNIIDHKNEAKLATETDVPLEPEIANDVVVSDNIIDQGNEAAKLATETDVPLETEIANEHVSDENKDSCPMSQVEDSISLTKVLNEPIEGSQNTTVLNGSSEDAENLPSPADCMRPEIEVESQSVENLLSCPVKDAKLEIEVKNGTVAGDKISNCNEVSSETDIALCSIDPEGLVTNMSCTEVNSESEVPNRVMECACSQPLSVNGLDPEYHANDSLQNGSSTDMKSESEVENSSSISGGDMTCNDATVSRSEVLDGCVVNCGSAPNCVPEALDVQDVRDQVNDGDGDDYDKILCQETKDAEWVHRDEISTSSPEGSSADAVVDQSAGLEAVKRPFHFLIKIPRYDDEKLREQLKQAELQVEEKTKRRAAIQVEIQKIRGNCQQLHNDYGAAKSEERAARGLVKSKRQEIDSVQSVINKVKNAISVEDIDVRMRNMEHMIQHETLPLKEEKQFIREIKQLKHLREQLSSNMGSQDEVQQALGQRHQIEEQLKILKKDLDCLKDKVSKAEATAEAAKKKYNDENKKLEELHAQFRAADGIRQEAYAHLLNLRQQSKEKKTPFRMYKDDSMAANEYALSGDKEALHRLCVNQVETIMELWNKNDEFQKEYVKCNTRSTLRRLRTLDGRALGPDEELPVLPNVVYERIDRSISTPGKGNTELLISNLEQEKQVSTWEGEETDGKSMAKASSEQMDQTMITKKPGKPSLRNGSATVSGRVEIEEMSEEEHKQTKEEQESARKEEELRKEKAAAKLKEERRLEEKAKAKEALERKRRHAEKAQIRAEVRAQKEAEQKEKEREKRAKKKEKQKAAVAEASDGNNEGETVPTSESPAVSTKGAEIKESPPAVTKRPQKPFQFTKQSKTKSIPPPLRNRGKRRMQQWIWVVLAALLVLALIMLGHFGFYSNLGHNLRM